jgi:hypothetical protein
MPKTTTTQSVNRNIFNSENYALMRDKGFTNLEIETMWQMPRRAIAAFQAWNTMSNRTWAKPKTFPVVDIDAITI